MGGAVLVLFPNVRYQNRESLYWGPVFDGISARLNQKGLDILTLTEPSNDHMFTLLNPQGILGIVTVGSVSTQNLMDIKKLNIPVVMVDHMDPAFQSDTVFTDNMHSMKQIMTKLISRGYKSISSSAISKMPRALRALDRLLVRAGRIQNRTSSVAIPDQPGD